MNKDEWNKIHEQGKTKYIFVHWIIAAGIPAAIVLLLVRGLFNDFSYSNGVITSLVLSIALCSFISLLWGIKKWRCYNRQFK